ncbi:tetratricopeptide repeat protein [Pelagibius litoralis]|uniref:Tetratricopeptide repeat protein n=1 Tax=Pelagibius litoralis TaxID=374515 RepID=A0A967EXW6_9PROT|nr:tetratricopeptide repeat protein [Pelagibius litoralis]NIA69443.1 tetratricopeptide repeat protein [Pelagibius litoralis]
MMFPRLLGLFLILGLWGPPLQAAEPVTMRGGLHPDHGRIVFDWPREVGYEARLEEGRLIVSFAEEAAFAGEPLRNGLRGYAEPPQVSDNGRSLSFGLTGALAMNHFRAGPKVVLELRREDVAAPQKAKAAAETAGETAGETVADAKTAALPTVKVRGGRHPEYSRLVFDWPDAVASRLEESPGRARIVFDRQARFDTSAVRPKGLPQIAAVSAEPDGVSITLPESSQLRVQRSGTKVILDVLAAKQAAPAKAAVAPQKDKPKVADVTPRPAPAAAAEKEAALPTEAATGPAEAADSKAKAASPTSLVPESMGGKAGAPAPEVVENESAEQGRVAASSPPAGLQTASVGASAGKDSATDEKAAAQFYGQTSATAVDFADSARSRLTVALEPVITFESSSAQGPTADRFVPVILTFDWDRPTAAAAFRRGENLWLTFDRPPPRNLVKLIAATAPHLGSVRLVEAGSATVMVIGALPTVAPRLTRDGNSWIVDLRPRSTLPQKALAAPVVEKKEYSRVRFPLSGAERLHWVTDPDAGDRLVIVPTRGAGMGMTLPYAYPQFRSLQSQQGVVLQPLASSLQVAVIRSGVLVRDPNGLLVSDPQQRQAVRRGEAEQTEPRLFDLVAWRRGSLDDYQVQRRDLLGAMIGSSGDQLGVQRVELARFHFAHGFDSEALGSLGVIEEKHPRLALDPEIRLMQAASQWLIRDFRAAAAGLAHASLAGEREALLWQAALAAQAEDWQAAANGFAATDDLIDSYARRIRLRLRLAAADAFLMSGDDAAATLQLGALRREDLNRREEAQVKVVQGALQLVRGNAEEARRLWNAARDSRHGPSQARARLALVDLGLEDGSLSADDAIAELERLRFAWRGDQFEFTLLRRLADLYVAENRHREALYTLRQAVTSFPDSPGARDSAQKMRQTFAEIYRDVGDPDVPPLRALALYQEFKELTPAGAEGDRLITGLADRLVEVDLLDRAAELLEGQVRYRLEGEEKARIGARLALIHLLNHNPDASLSALEVSEAEGGDAALMAQRRQLRARAFSDLNRADDGLKMLEGDDSLDAEMLRADIHWRLRQWPQAVDSLAKLVPLLPPARAMLLSESQQVVNLAVALMLSNQAVELEDLNRRYGAAMAKGPHSDTFNLLVGDGEKSAISSIADELGKVAQAQDFMANYRERLKDGELSQVN